MKKYSDGYYICLNNKNEPIGFIGEVNDDIRIAVIAKFQRMGAGKFMIKEFMKLRPNSYAKMKLDNIASKKLFESCSFIHVKTDENFYYFIKK